MADQVRNRTVALGVPTGMGTSRRVVRGRSTRALSLVAVLALAACGVPALDDAETDDGGQAGRREASDPDTPPPVVVRAGERSVELESHHHCYGNACVSGVPPDEPPDLGTADAVEVEFPLDGWAFTASLRQAGQECGRVQDSVPLEPRDDGTFVLEPVGHAGTYDVELWGQGDEGDLFVIFTWTTSRDGPLREPEAYVSVLADNRGQVDSYGVELSVRHLAETPEEAEATISVTAPDGQSTTFAAVPTETCEEGSVRWDGPRAEGDAAAALADTGPFAYEVVLVLDGARYSAVATWPDDQIDGFEPYVALEFDPPLPGLRD